MPEADTQDRTDAGAERPGTARGPGRSTATGRQIRVPVTCPARHPLRGPAVQPRRSGGHLAGEGWWPGHCAGLASTGRMHRERRSAIWSSTDSGQLGIDFPWGFFVGVTVVLLGQGRPRPPRPRLLRYAYGKGPSAPAWAAPGVVSPEPQAAGSRCRRARRPRPRRPVPPVRSRGPSRAAARAAVAVDAASWASVARFTGAERGRAGQQGRGRDRVDQDRRPRRSTRVGGASSDDDAATDPGQGHQAPISQDVAPGPPGDKCSRRRGVHASHSYSYVCPLAFPDTRSDRAGPPRLPLNGTSGDR